MTFTAFDPSGHEQAYQVWENYEPAVNGIVFLLDCAYHPHPMKNKIELKTLITDETVSNVPVLIILSNKINIANEINEEKLHEIFGLHGQTIEKGNVTLHTS